MKCLIGSATLQHHGCGCGHQPSLQAAMLSVGLCAAAATELQVAQTSTAERSNLFIEYIINNYCCFKNISQGFPVSFRETSQLQKGTYKVVKSSILKKSKEQYIKAKSEISKSPCPSCY
jgi:hypothetical protein